MMTMTDESATRERVVPRPTRTQQIFLYIAPFLALAFFKIWASLGREAGTLLIAATAMLIYCSAVLALAKHWDKPTYFDWAAGAYFLIITVLLVLWPGAAGAIVSQYAVTGIYCCLFAAAFVPPLLGLEPFTYHYAKKYAPRAVWQTPVFVSINRTMTFAWASLLAVCILISLYPSVITRALIPIGLIVGVGIPFNFRFPDYYLKRVGLPTIAEMRKFGTPPPSSFSPGASVSNPLPSTGGDKGRVTLEQSSVQITAAGRSVESTGLHLSSNGPHSATGTVNQPQTKKETTMKVIAINSSARSDGVSKTAMMLDALVQGMRDAGAKVEVIPLRKKSVKNCIGCFTCWTKTPGVCIHQDDMANEIFPKWLEADIAVYATPLYHFTVNAVLKAFIERTLPILEPFMVRVNGRTTHPLRQKPPKAVVLSVAGFPDTSVFTQLSSYVNFLFNKGLIAEIYRPGAETMPHAPEIAKDILQATSDAGRELVQSSKVSEATMSRITQPIADFDACAKMANAFWKTCIQEGVTPREFEQRNLIPRPDSIDTFMMIMSQGFNREAAGQSKAVLQFNFSGEVGDSCYFTIENGTIQSGAGTADKPDLVIESPFSIWLDIMTGKADGQQMFMEQKYKTAGDLSLLMRMKELFGQKPR
jgi:multimeric flavodoxin WrbA/putative sterol carrier protein